jgi:DNA-binding NtrC family response regulator
VYGIVRQNGGSIDVESDPSIGTTFRIYLPRVVENERESITGADLSSSKKSAGVLLVEDEPALLKVGKLALKKLGYRAYSATNPREALQVVQAHGHRIHVIITDIVLPSCNGWDLARQIHGMQENIRFVFMSGYGDDALPTGMASQHPFAVLSKPFDLQQLAEAIHAAVALPPRTEV